MKHIFARAKIYEARLTAYEAFCFAKYEAKPFSGFMFKKTKIQGASLVLHIGLPKPMLHIVELSETMLHRQATLDGFILMWLAGWLVMWCTDIY